MNIRMEADVREGTTFLEFLRKTWLAYHLQFFLAKTDRSHYFRFIFSLTVSNALSSKNRFCTKFFFFLDKVIFPDQGRGEISFCAIAKKKEGRMRKKAFQNKKYYLMVTPALLAERKSPGQMEGEIKGGDK